MKAFEKIGSVGVYIWGFLFVTFVGLMSRSAIDPKINSSGISAILLGDGPISSVKIEKEISRIPTTVRVRIAKKLTIPRLSGELRAARTPQFAILGASAASIDLATSQAVKAGLDRVEFVPVSNALGIKQYDAVARIELESYLKGVLPSEMPASWHDEALKAQAIAARTYTVYQILKRKERLHFDVDASVQDQVFNFKKFLALSKERKKKIVRSLVETKGQILIDPEKKVLAAFYHSHCGGHGEEPDNVWKNGLHLGARKDSCQSRIPMKWRKKFKEKDLAVFFERTSGVKKNEPISLKVIKRTKSGRVLLMELSRGSERVRLSGHEFRESIGFSKLKSTAFQFERMGDEFYFSGKGYGHGAGLCQWGTKLKAKRGIKHRSILKHYYPQAQVARIAERLAVQL